MANELYVLSALAKAQVKASQQFGASETRAVTPAVMGLALQNAAISIPAAEQARVHEKRVVDITFFSKKSQGSTTAKSINPTVTKGSSKKVNLLYVTVVESFSVNAKLADNNVYSEQEIFQNEYSQTWKNLVTRQNQAATDYLLANRCQLADQSTPIANSGAGVWNSTNFALEIPVASKDLRLLKAESFMKARYFDGEYDVIADLATEAELKKVMFQGSNNGVNTAFQFGNSNIVASQVGVSTISEYVNGQFIILPKGGFAGICWNDQMNLRNTDKGLAVGMFTTVSDPFGYGCKADLMIKSALVDSSADTVSGSTQDIIDTYEMSLTIAYVLNPLTATGDSVAHLAAIVA